MMDNHVRSGDSPRRDRGLIALAIVFAVAAALAASMPTLLGKFF